MIGKGYVMALTPLALAALGLLVERPMHPYEMYQLLLERGKDRIVKVRPGSLYHTVERLEDHALVESTGTTREGNRPERTTYAVTDLGRQMLRDRIGDLLTHPVKEYPHLPFALGEADNLPPDQVVTALQHYADTLDDDIVDISARLDTLRSREHLPEIHQLAASYVLTMTTTQRDWIRTLIARIDTKDLTWQPAHQ